MRNRQRRPQKRLHRLINIGLVTALTFAALVGVQQPAPAVPLSPATAKPQALATTFAANDNIQRSSSRARDVTGDGWPDLVAREPGVNNGALWVYRHTGQLNGTLTFATRVLVGTSWNNHNWIGVAELTGDVLDPDTAPEPPADILARRASDGALMLYPHSGTFNGTSTYQTPVVVGTGWNIYSEMTLADVTADGFDDIIAYDGTRIWVYEHTRTFNGGYTFKTRVQARTGSVGWLLATEWHRDTPDLITNYFATGDMVVSRHLRDSQTTTPWSTSSTQVAAGLFTGSFVNLLALCDINGNGTDDIIVRSKSGTLIAYPFTGVNGLNTFGEPMTIGNGWQIMDLIT